jgi:hypothetical protein
MLGLIVFYKYSWTAYSDFIHGLRKKKCAIQDARVAILLNQQAQVGILKICIVPILHCQAIYIFCIETQHTKPGYVRLILETDKSRTRESISSSCHNYDDKLYISSTKYREYHMSSLGNKVEVHGPCASIKYDLMPEDYAFCLSCTSQPADFKRP